MTLSETVDSTYSDRSAGDKQHQQDHDDIHPVINAINDAYDAAVAGGYAGTKQEWLELIHVDTPSPGETMGCVVHGSSSGTARPSGFAAVTWIGSVEPTNAANDDVWIDTA